MHAVIAGAGPCGLLAALQLQRAGIQVTVLERASEDKLEADVGSGYDLSPSTLEVLRRLGFGEHIGTTFGAYEAMYAASTEGPGLRMAAIAAGHGETGDPLCMAKRSDLQRLFLSALKRESVGTTRMVFGVEVLGFEETEAGVAVQCRPRQHLEGGEQGAFDVSGDVLLACDGIHSAVRRAMHRGAEDQLNFTGGLTWWGNSEAEPGSALEREMKMTQQLGKGFFMVLGTPRNPGSFMGATVSGTAVTWALTLPPSAAAEAAELVSSDGSAGDDLTRRGGVVGNRAKQLAMKAVSGYGSSLIKEAVAAADADKTTLVGLFDRQDLSLPWASPRRRAVLLGDAAHPQSPMQGQGVNQAINDAYCMSRRLIAAASKQGPVDLVPTAVSAYDSPARRKGVNGVIMRARTLTAWSISQSWLQSWLLRAYMAWAPTSWILSEAISADLPNRDALQALDRDLLD